MTLSGWNRKTSPYHAGERELHDRLGRLEHQTRMGLKIHRPFMPEQHRKFFADLPFMFVGSVDQHGWPWASVVFGSPGFAQTPNDTSMLIHASPIIGDPLIDNMQPGAALGLLGIEHPTRRRNRMNGVLKQGGDGRYEVDVVQSFGNCPQYIQSRDMEWIRDPGDTFTPELESFSEIDEILANVIQQADTFFVASFNDRDDKYDTGGADINHRGGRPGFVRVDGNTLTIPDYVGNFAFNTLGNFQIYPKAGLLFMDFESGDLWQLTGTVDVLWDKTEEIAAFRGAERAWRFHCHHGVRLKQAVPLRWRFNELSPNSQLTGDWEDARQTLQAQESRDTWRPYTVTRVEEESEFTRSFYLKAADGDGHLTYLPGQYLTLRALTPDGQEHIRTYTLSSAPSDEQYRISVKRETTTGKPSGIVSNFLHDTLEIGDVIQAKSPRGDFAMDTRESRPAALFAGGVGITPMISMVRQVSSDVIRLRHRRPVTVFHSARNTAERAFAAEMTNLQNASHGLLQYISVIGSPQVSEQAGIDFHVAGRLSRELVQATLPLADYDCYICGPAEYMQSVYDLLIELGINDERIYAESFGPASLMRMTDAADPATLAYEPVQESLVYFAKSGVELAWTTDDGTLLELAEAHGLNPNFGCRGGACGSCAVRKLGGQTGYTQKPRIDTHKDEVLLCCAVPAKADERLSLDW